MEKFAISQIKNDCNREDNKTFCIFYPENLEKITEFRKWGFISSASDSNYDVCQQYDKCNGQGECRQITDTKTHGCICIHHFEGESCSEPVNLNDAIEEYKTPRVTPTKSSNILKSSTTLKI